MKKIDDNENTKPDSNKKIELSDTEMKSVSGGLFILPLIGGLISLGGAGAANLALNATNPAGK